MGHLPHFLYIVAANERFKRSLLDRLLDDPQENGSGQVVTYSLEQLRDAVARDVEALLNSRAILDADALKDYPYSQNSVLSYGIKDFVGRVASNSEDQRLITRSLARTIEIHEPRLQQVRVSFHDISLTHSRNTLAFSIYAMLIAYPSAEPVGFDAVLLPNLSRIELRAVKFNPSMPLR